MDPNPEPGDRAAQDAEPLGETAQPDYAARLKHPMGFTQHLIDVLFREEIQHEDREKAVERLNVKASSYPDATPRLTKFQDPPSLRFDGLPVTDAKLESSASS